MKSRLEGQVQGHWGKLGILKWLLVFIWWIFRLLLTLIIGPARFVAGSKRKKPLG